MEVFVKDFFSYQTIKKASSVESSIVVDSFDSESSLITVRGLSIDNEDIGNWLIVDDQVFQICTVTPVNGQTQITLQHPLDMFLRPILLQKQTTNQTIGGFVASVLQKHWINEADLMYALPYLVVSNLDTTAFVSPETDESGCFVLTEYCRLMRKTYGVTLIFSNAGNKLNCVISKITPAGQNVSFFDGRSYMESVNYGTSGYAKLTVYNDIKTGEKDVDGNSIYTREVTTWYLSEDYSASQLIPSRRSVGEWGVLHLKDCANVSEKVIEKFLKNRAGLKIEFQSLLDLNVGEKCKFVINGKPIESYIAYKRKDSASDRFYYKAGELKTTVTEKLKGVLQ